VNGQQPETKESNPSPLQSFTALFATVTYA